MPALVGWAATAAIRPLTARPPAVWPLVIGAGPRAVQAVLLSGIDVDGSQRPSSASSVSGRVWRGRGMAGLLGRTRWGARSRVPISSTGAVTRAAGRRRSYRMGKVVPPPGESYASQPGQAAAQSRPAERRHLSVAGQHHRQPLPRPRRLRLAAG